MNELYWATMNAQKYANKLMTKAPTGMLTADSKQHIDMKCRDRAASLIVGLWS